MLSGSRPRGSSSTPASGKIGRTKGSAVPPSRSLIPAPLRKTSGQENIWSGKHLGGEPSPASQGQRIGRPHRLEEFDELLACRLLVPLAVALEQTQEFIDRRLAIAAAEECGGELETRLVIIGIGRQPGAQLARPGHRLLRLLGELERRTRRADLGVSRTLL